MIDDVFTMCSGVVQVFQTASIVAVTVIFVLIFYSVLPLNYQCKLEMTSYFVSFNLW